MGVGASIINRAEAENVTILQVIQSPGQFEAYANNRFWQAPFITFKEDLRKFLVSEGTVQVGSFTIEGREYPGFRLNTLTIWYDPDQYLPVFRQNMDRGNLITDEFVYHTVNAPLPAEVFTLPKPAEAITDFNLYPEAPTLPRFENVTESPQYGVYVNTLLEEIKRYVILNQWGVRPFFHN